MATVLSDLPAEQKENVLFFVPQNFQEEQRNKLLIRLAKNFTPAQLDEIEAQAMHYYKKDKNNYID